MSASSVLPDSEGQAGEDSLPRAGVCGKFLVFNIAVIASYLVIIYLFGLQGVLEDVGPLGQYSVLALLALGNVVFWIYDVALSRIITAYREVLRKRFSAGLADRADLTGGWNKAVQDFSLYTLYSINLF